MKTIYRIEKPSGGGPYGNPCKEFSDFKYTSIRTTLCLHNISGKHPTWLEDFSDSQNLKLWEATQHGFEVRSGFETIKQLFMWFGGLIPIFYKKTEYRIRKYVVSEDDVFYSTSGKQIIFIRNKTLIN